jgi:iron complex outermembrane recepter protein
LRTISGLHLLLSLGAACAAAAAELPSIRDLTELTLEQLANLEITSVSKRPERIADAPASVFVITGDDIRRSGATTLPEALRLAPNLQVAQVSASGYNIRARGINNTSANKLLVMIDGRSVYTPLFSGVFWDVQDLMLEDIERIEVISGPGGTLWGANAVNGVINVITRAAKDTRGALLAAGMGDLESFAAVRQGATLGARGNYRVYAKYSERDHSTTASGSPMDDAWHKAQAGFRADWDLGDDRFTAHGNAYSGTMGQPKPGSVSIGGVDLALAAIPVSGANLTTQWAHRFGDGSEASLQAYYDQTKRTVPPTFAETLDIVDLQFQHSSRFAGAHDFVWGAEYRYSRDRLVNGDLFAFLPASLDQRWGSLFAQSESSLRDDLRLTLGVRLERNDYTGTEYLPSMRLAWKAAPEHLLWTAASRTVRAPSRLDRDAFIPGTPPFLLAGGPDVRSEVANVYEVGYRGYRGGKSSLSVTVFHADYDHLRTQEIAPSRTFIVFASQMEASTTGVEIWGTHQVSSAWRLAAGFTGQRERLRLKPGSNDAGAVATAGRDPAHTWIVRSSLNLSDRTDFDVSARGVAALANPAVPAYSAVDLRLAWRPSTGLELAILARNLFDNGHGEFTSVTTRAEIERSVQVTVRWTFGAL